MVTVKYALKGRVVTMDAARTVMASGIVWVNEASIAGVTQSEANRPAGFAGVAVTDTKGTIYPGLIELHNHLAYNPLTLWQVPKLYGNRDQWPDHAEYSPARHPPHARARQRAGPCRGHRALHGSQVPVRRRHHVARHHAREIANHQARVSWRRAQRRTAARQTLACGCNQDRRSRREGHHQACGAPKEDQVLSRSSLGRR